MAETVERGRDRRKNRRCESEGRPGRLSVAAIALLLWVPSTEGAAQTTLNQPHDRRVGVVDVRSPAYADSDFSALGLTGIVVLPVRPRVTVVTGWGLIAASADGVARSVTVSNAYVSLQLGRGDGGFGTITLTLPTTGKLTNQAYAADAGLLQDLETPERYTPRALGIAVSATPRLRVDESTQVGGRLGVAVVSPSGTESEFYARYAVFGNRGAGPLEVSAELSGALFLRSRAAGFSDSSVHHLTASVRGGGQPVGPELVVRLPLDRGARGATDVVWGLRFGVPF